jgi:hypothetical protein
MQAIFKNRTELITFFRLGAYRSRPLSAIANLVALKCPIINLVAADFLGPVFFCQPVLVRGVVTLVDAGPRAKWLAIGPARFNSRPSPTNEKKFKKILATPPQPHVRKKLESRPVRENRLRLAWIAAGFTAQSFWTGTRRWIAPLESKSRFGLRTRL